MPYYEVTEFGRLGYLRLETGNLTNSVVLARNTLTQRTEGPACKGITLMDILHMKPGDYADMVSIQNSFGTVGIKAEDNGNKYVAMCINRGDGGEEVVEKRLFHSNLIYLKIEFNFEESIDIAEFYYSADGAEWIKIGNPLKMKYTLDHFMGYRCGLFNYATKQINGYVDFDYFHYKKQKRVDTNERRKH